MHINKSDLKIYNEQGWFSIEKVNFIPAQRQSALKIEVFRGIVFKNTYEVKNSKN